MTKKELKRWNEKHFQICLILLEQEAASSECMMNKLEMVNIISRANKMIQLLYEREKSLKAKYDEKIKGQCFSFKILGLCINMTLLKKLILPYIS